MSRGWILFLCNEVVWLLVLLNELKTGRGPSGDYALVKADYIGFEVLARFLKRF